MTDHGTKRALVLGGGGPVGIAWELGLAAGLAAGGVELRDADRVIGTSAGSITGAMLQGGEDPTNLVDNIERLVADGAGASGADQVSTDGLAAFMEMTFAGAAAVGDDEQRAHRRSVGEFALAASSLPEDEFVDTIGSVLAGRPWPEGFACTAVDAATGEFRVWDADADVPLERAVASSCSVPGVYPPITINGSRYVDGGVRSALNADIATGCDIAVVISVMVLELPPGIDDPRISGLLGSMRAEVEALQASGSDVALIVPDMEFMVLSSFGMSLMDFSLLTPAAEAGRRLGLAEAERVAKVWNA